MILFYNFYFQKDYGRKQRHRFDPQRDDQQTELRPVPGERLLRIGTSRGGSSFGSGGSKRSAQVENTTAKVKTISNYAF